MAELISRLRDTYRPTASAEFQPASINTLVLEVQKLLASHLRRNEIEFIFSPDETLAPFPVIKDQIKASDPQYLLERNRSNAKRRVNPGQE